MAAPSPLPSAPPGPPPIPAPLRLPTGSVRAILALTLCGTLWSLILREVTPPTILVESALLVVAFYFGVRSTAPVVPVQVAPKAAPTTRVRQPLFLPRGVIRTILAVGFLGVVAYLFYRGRSIEPPFVLILQVIMSYVIGYLFSAILLRRAQAGKGLGRGAAAVRNFISVAATGITVGVCWAIASETFYLVPDYLKNGLAWTIAFYFGSRLAPS